MSPCCTLFCGGYGRVLRVVVAGTSLPRMSLTSSCSKAASKRNTYDVEMVPVEASRSGTRTPHIPPRTSLHLCPNRVVHD